METYYFRRYRRIGPGQTTGIITDEVKFVAESGVDAEISVRKRVGFMMGAMDWEKDFARLEDEHGHVMVEWLHTFSNA